MSQSDYLKRKRIATTLQNDSTRYPVFSERDLLDFKQFSLENSITHDKELINRVLPENKRLVFNIEQTVDSCPSFIVCTGTHARPNRQPLVVGPPGPVDYLPANYEEFTSPLFTGDLPRNGTFYYALDEFNNAFLYMFISNPLYDRDFSLASIEAGAENPALLPTVSPGNWKASAFGLAVGKLCQILPLTWQEKKEASEIKYNQCACPAT